MIKERWSSYTSSFALWRILAQVTSERLAVCWAGYSMSCHAHDGTACR